MKANVIMQRPTHSVGFNRRLHRRRWRSNLRVSRPGVLRAESIGATRTPGARPNQVLANGGAPLR
eukprot:7892824-Lingulodinium_polyedra.AAC.1